MPYREEPHSRKPAMTDKQKPSKPEAKAAATKPAAKPQPYKGPPSNKADHAAFKRIDKNVMKRMRVK
jgi:hypothetical protein